MARPPRSAPTPSGGVGWTKYAETIPDPAQEETNQEDIEQKRTRPENSEIVMKNRKYFPPVQGSDKNNISSAVDKRSLSCRRHHSSYDQGRDTMYSWTGSSIKSVPVGPHACCLLRDRRREALFLSCTRRLRTKIAPRWKKLVFHLRYASQVLQYDPNT